MNISNLGRLIGAGLLALGLHAVLPDDAERAEGGAATASNSTEPSRGALVGTLAAGLNPADEKRPTESPE